MNLAFRIFQADLVASLPRINYVSPFARFYQFDPQQPPAGKFVCLFPSQQCELDPYAEYCGQWMYAQSRCKPLRERTGVFTIVVGNDSLIVVTEGGVAAVYRKPLFEYVKHLNGPPPGTLLIKAVWFNSISAEYTIVYGTCDDCENCRILHTLSVSEAALLEHPSETFWKNWADPVEIRESVSPIGQDGFIEWSAECGWCMSCDPYSVFQRSPQRFVGYAIQETSVPKEASPMLPRNVSDAAQSPPSTIVMSPLPPTSSLGRSTGIQRGVYRLWWMGSQICHLAVKFQDTLREARLYSQYLMLINHTTDPTLLPFRVVDLPTRSFYDIQLRMAAGAPIDVLDISCGRVLFRQRNHRLRIVDLVSQGCLSVDLPQLLPSSELRVRLIHQRRKAVLTARQNGDGLLWIINLDGVVLHGPSKVYLTPDDIQGLGSPNPIILPMVSCDAVAVLRRSTDLRGKLELWMLSLSPRDNQRAGLLTELCIGSLQQGSVFSGMTAGLQCTYDEGCGFFYLSSPNGRVMVVGRRGPWNECPHEHQRGVHWQQRVEWFTEPCFTEYVFISNMDKVLILHSHAPTNRFRLDNERTNHAADREHYTRQCMSLAFLLWYQHKFLIDIGFVTYFTEFHSVQGIPLMSDPEAQMYFMVDATAVVFHPECGEVLDMVVLKTTNVESQSVVDVVAGSFHTNYQTTDPLPRIDEISRVQLRAISSDSGGGPSVITAVASAIPGGRRVANHQMRPCITFIHLNE